MYIYIYIMIIIFVLTITKNDYYMSYSIDVELTYGSSTRNPQCKTGESMKVLLSEKQIYQHKTLRKVC